MNKECGQTPSRARLKRKMIGCEEKGKGENWGKTSHNRNEEELVWEE